MLVSENENQPVKSSSENMQSPIKTNYQAVPSGNGILWLKQAITLFTKKPAAWLATAFVFLITLLILSSIPYLNAGSFIITPIFIGGLMFGCQQLKTKNHFHFNYLFSGFNQHLHQLGVIGILYLLATIIAWFLTLQIVDYLGHSLYKPDVENLLQNKEEISKYVQSLVLPMTIMLLFLLPIYMGLWFSPALVILRDEPALNAIKKSLSACKANMLPFLIFGLAALSGILVLTIPLALIASLFPTFSVFFFILYNLALFSLLIAVQYTSFEDIFPATNLSTETILDSDSLTL